MFSGNEIAMLTLADMPENTPIFNDDLNRLDCRGHFLDARLEIFDCIFIKVMMT